MMRKGPFCRDANHKILTCSANATRTKRAGIRELKYELRDDRQYCEYQFFRDRSTPEAEGSVEECRAELAARIERCGLTCTTCDALCTDPVVRELVRGHKCAAGFPGLGMQLAFHESDAGFDIRNRWSADRKNGKEAWPERAFIEQFHVLIQNSITKPSAPRNSISCRRPHRESTFGAYVPPLDNNGDLIERKGFMVPCETDSDCHTRCGDHPVSGRAYVCTHNLQLYSYAGYGESSDEVLLGMLEEEDQAAEKKAQSATAARKKLGSLKEVSDSNEPCPKGWRRNFENGCEARGMSNRPDARDKDYYTFDMPGDDTFDVQNHSVGVCTDVNLGYGHTGCDDRPSARARMAIGGCTGRAFGWATVFCGIELEVRGPDYVTDVSMSEASILYPRTLVPATEVNGKLQNKIECSNPIECQQRCEYLSRIARDGGLPEPSACSFCNPPCPSDPGTIAADFFTAFFNDLTLLLRLTAICGFTLGMGEACVCEIFMLVRAFTRTPTRHDF